MGKKFDIERVIYKLEHSPYNVKYYIYKDNEKYSAWFTKTDVKDKKYRVNTTTCCFSQLSQMLTTFSKEHTEWPNRLLFLCDFKKHDKSKYHTTYGERCWWITICKKYKLLPTYINNEFAKSGNLILKIDTLTLNIIYLYLTVARYLQEEPYFIKAIKYLIDIEYIDFYTAFAVASRCCICNKGHHIIPVCKKYPLYNKHNDINSINTYDLTNIIRLKKFLNGEGFKKRIPIKDKKVGSFNSYFDLHKQLAEINVEETTIKRKDLTSEKVIKTLYN